MSAKMLTHSQHSQSALGVNPRLSQTQRKQHSDAEISGQCGSLAHQRLKCWLITVSRQSRGKERTWCQPRLPALRRSRWP